MKSGVLAIITRMKIDSVPNIGRGLSRALALIAVFFVSACGWAEVSSTVRGPVPTYAPRRTGPDVFINATAVTVGRGDTVYSVARRHKLSPRDVIEANGLMPPYELTVGQRLVLPKGRIHTVQRGEYIALIAKKYGADAFSLARINGIRPPYTIFPGQKLRIPRSMSRGNAVRVASRSSSSASSARIKPRAAPRESVTSTRIKTRHVNKTKVPPPPARSGATFSWPLKGRVISGFGTKKKGLQNDGVNIAAKRGTPVKAAENGVVAYSGNEIRGFGNLLLIKHRGGWVTAYAHNETLLVKRGDKVVRGQSIAKVGSTGSVTTPQLHFELRKGSNAVDPKKYLM